MHVFVQELNFHLDVMTYIGKLLGGIRSYRIYIEERMREVIAFETAMAEVDCILCSPL